MSSAHNAAVTAHTNGGAGVANADVLLCINLRDGNAVSRSPSVQPAASVAPPVTDAAAWTPKVDMDERLPSSGSPRTTAVAERRSARADTTRALATLQRSTRPLLSWLTPL